MESRGPTAASPHVQPALRLRPVDLFPILSCALFLALFFLLDGNENRRGARLRGGFALRLHRPQGMALVQQGLLASGSPSGSPVCLHGAGR